MGLDLIVLIISLNLCALSFLGCMSYTNAVASRRQARGTGNGGFMEKNNYLAPSMLILSSFLVALWQSRCLACRFNTCCLQLKVHKWKVVCSGALLSVGVCRAQLS